MGFFPNWPGVLLDAANLDHGSDNLTFMNKWHADASSDCRNNPVDISRSTGGSTKCKVLTSSRTAQTYASPADAADGFSGQIRSGNFPHLLALLVSGQPPTQANYADVSADLRKWGSPKYAGYIVQQYGPPPAGIGAPKLHSGWGAMRISFNNHMVDTLKESRRNTNAALRALARARKVRL